MSTETVFWSEDLLNFVNEKNYLEIIPTKDMTYAQQLNSISRFALYYSILLFIFKRDVSSIYVFLIIAAFTAFLYHFDNNKKQQEMFVMNKLGVMKNKQSSYCYKPTTDNPFMNVTYGDYKDFPNRPKACNVADGKVKSTVNKYFDKNLYRDVDDVHHKNASDRQYYTNPVTTIPNDQEGFAKWLYATEKTCKEGNGNRCHMYNDYNFDTFNK